MAGRVDFDVGLDTASLGVSLEVFKLGCCPDHGGSVGTFCG